MNLPYKKIIGKFLYSFATMSLLLLDFEKIWSEVLMRTTKLENSSTFQKKEEEKVMRREKLAIKS